MCFVLKIVRLRIRWLNVVSWTFPLCLRLLTVLLGALLHLLHSVVPSPQRYPDIWTLLITGVSCGALALEPTSAGHARAMNPWVATNGCSNENLKFV